MLVTVSRFTNRNTTTKLKVRLRDPIFFSEQVGAVVVTVYYVLHASRGFSVDERKESGPKSI